MTFLKFLSPKARKKRTKAQLEDGDEPQAVRSLPVFNFLALDPAKVDALLEVALATNRPCLSVHLSKVYFGFVSATAVSHLL
jgi:hypothetical protein